MTINTEAGLRTTSERLIEMLRSFGANPRQIFFKVSLPSALPFILAGLKLGIGRGRSALWWRSCSTARRAWAADRPVGRRVQHAGAVRRRDRAGGRRHHAHRRLRLAGEAPRAMDQGLA